MKRCEGGTMRHADDRRAGKLPPDQLVESALAGLVERCGCFVEIEPIWALQENACEREALLLAGRKLQCPVARLVESSGEIG